MISVSDLGAAKLIVWDLDGTLWTGTLDNGDELQPTGLHRWIEPLARAGVMSSVCSNNDRAVAEAALTALGVWDYVIFPKVSWMPKAQLLTELLSDVGVRPSDVLLVDDLRRHRELASAELGCRTASPTEVDPYVGQQLGPTNLDRLDQYRTSERRVASRRASRMSDEEFLRRSGITVTITPTFSHAARLSALSQRSNQLNYTGSRLDEVAVRALALDADFETGAVWVKDNYGDYGLSGYYAIRDEKLQHFFFSCRVLNMGVESFVHAHIGRPEVQCHSAAVKQEQERRLLADAPWVQLSDTPPTVRLTRKQALWIGGCDLQIMSSYLGHDVDTDCWLLPTELRGAQVYGRSSLLALLAEENQLGLFANVPWLTADVVDVRDGPWRDLVLSPWVDCASWTYRHRGTGVRIPSFVALDADSSDWEWDHWWGNNPGRERFLRDFEIDSPLSPAEVSRLLSDLAGKVGARRVLVMTVPEIASNRIYPWGENQRDRHIAFNAALERVAGEVENVELLDVREVVANAVDLHDPDDPVVFHFRRDRYVELAHILQMRLLASNEAMS